jgi:uncharacterized membrane protein YedE/YeeE
METQILGFFIGGLFGMALFLSGLAEPDKIVGTLRLKDFHAMRTIAVFVLTGMLGTWFLEMAGVAHFSVKPATMLTVTLGGALLGIGFGLTGYCPGTGLACAASGRLDALITALGMFFGALVFILIYPYIIKPLDAIADYGQIMLPEVTGISRGFWVSTYLIAGTLVLFVTSRKQKQDKS